jgi:hypothetical protein
MDRVKLILKQLFILLYNVLLNILDSIADKGIGLSNYLDSYYPRYKILFMLTSFYFCLLRLLFGIGLIILNKQGFSLIRQISFIIVIECILIALIYYFNFYFLVLTYKIINFMLFPFIPVKLHENIPLIMSTLNDQKYFDYQKMYLKALLILFYCVEQFFAFHFCLVFIILFTIIKVAPYSEILFCIFITLVLLRITYSIITYPFLFNSILSSNLSLYIKITRNLNEQFPTLNDINLSFFSIKNRKLYKFTIFSYLFYKIINWIAKKLDIPIIPLEKPKTLISQYPVISLHYENINFLYKYFIYSFYYHINYYTVQKIK